eukprot:539103-Amphidinium_carterae.1
MGMSGMHPDFFPVVVVRRERSVMAQWIRHRPTEPILRAMAQRLQIRRWGVRISQASFLTFFFPGARAPQEKMPRVSTIVSHVDRRGR